MADRTKKPEPTVQLRRLFGGFISAPMPQSEADAVMAGYPGEYEIWPAPEPQPADKEG